MKPRLLVALVLLVAIPLGTLIWGGLRMARHEQEREERRFETLLRSRLGEINAAIARSVEQSAQELLRATDVDSFDVDSLRSLRRNTRLARQFFVLDAAGRLMYPDEQDSALTQGEREFLERTRFLWTDGETFYHPADRVKKGGVDYGWHTWYRDQGIQVIFWHRLSSGHVIGAEVSRPAMMADIIAALPASQPAAWPTKTFITSEIAGTYSVPERLVLSGLDGESIYEWGSYAPQEGQAPLVRIPVVSPFSSWSLAVYMPPDAVVRGLGHGAVLNVAAATAGVFVALLLLAVYFYRESSRDMREAEQRVSFVNQVSHELRTPLTNIRLYAEMLEAGLSRENERIRRQAQIVVSESRRLSRLIGNVLTFARGRRNGLKLHATPGVIDACIESVLTSFRPLLETRQIAIECISGAPQACLFDADALEQIVGNLLSNVEKYAAEGRWLRMETAQDGDRITVTVSDRGPGIPASSRRRVFEPFFRVSNRVNEGASGTGIGLGIARELARLHGGDVELVTSESGACFRVTLCAPSVPTTF